MPFAETLFSKYNIRLRNIKPGNVKEVRKILEEKLKKQASLNVRLKTQKEANLEAEKKGGKIKKKKQYDKNIYNSSI